MHRRVIYPPVFTLVASMAFIPEVISFLNLVSAIVNRNKDTKVVQIEE
jgi:hypothetical protein